MRTYAWLGLIPVALNLAGVFLANRVQPLIFGVPFFLAWIVGCVVATSVVMWLIFRLDPANRGDR